MTNNKNYDAVIILGRGIYKDGTIPESVKPTIKKAVELYNNRLTKKVVFGGKWTYKIDYTPPSTEARAMAECAFDLGLPKDVSYLEESSYTTVSNAYYIKKEILEPNRWKHIALISVYPMGERAKYVLSFVFGPDYTCDLVTADYSYPPDVLKIKEKDEKTKLKIAQQFYEQHNLKPGDHERIFEVTNKDLKENSLA